MSQRSESLFSLRNMDIIEDQEKSPPLSAAQLGLWFAQRIDPTDPIYQPRAVDRKIHGPVNSSLFKAAVKQAVIDTEAVRVRFIEELDGPRQIIDLRSEVSQPLFDVSAELDPRAAAEAWMKADFS